MNYYECATGLVIYQLVNHENCGNNTQIPHKKKQNFEKTKTLPIHKNSFKYSNYRHQPKGFSIKQRYIPCQKSSIRK